MEDSAENNKRNETLKRRRMLIAPVATALGVTSCLISLILVLTDKSSLNILSISFSMFDLLIFGIGLLFIGELRRIETSLHAKQEKIEHPETQILTGEFRLWMEKKAKYYERLSHRIGVSIIILLAVGIMIIWNADNLVSTKSNEALKSKIYNLIDSSKNNVLK